MKDTIDSRAVKIAARVMQAAGLCRYDSIAKCHRVYVEEITCRGASGRGCSPRPRKSSKRRKNSDTIPG